jgi:hypothetical protein
VIFDEGLQQYRDLLEPGGAVILFLTAEAQGEEVRAHPDLPSRSTTTAELQSGLRVVLSDEVRWRPWPSACSPPAARGPAQTASLRRSGRRTTGARRTATRPTGRTAR